MAVQFKDGVVVGADSRTTTGSYIVRNVNHRRISHSLTFRLGKPCNRQAHACSRPHLLLSIRLSRRHTSHCGYCTLLSPVAHVSRRCTLFRGLACIQTLVLFSQMSGSPPPVHTAATMFQKLCYDNKDALSAGIIVAGWDKEAGPSVYNIPLGGGLFKQPWAIGGSGSTYVYGYCDATYQDGWDRDQTVEFVKNSACFPPHVRL